MANLRSELLRRLAAQTSRSEEELRQCIEANEELREMFIDYRRCHEMLREWQVSLNRDRGRLEDFEELSQSIEHEIADFLADH
jgi:hypothetical protein